MAAPRPQRAAEDALVVRRVIAQAATIISLCSRQGREVLFSALFLFTDRNNSFSCMSVVVL
jgi:uncharacterized protein YrzB (UPF0473 family)